MLQQWVRLWSQRHLRPTLVQHLWRAAPPQHHVSQHIWKITIEFVPDDSVFTQKRLQGLCVLCKNKKQIPLVHFPPYCSLDTVSAVQFTTASLWLATWLYCVNQQKTHSPATADRKIGLERERRRERDGHLIHRPQYPEQLSLSLAYRCQFVVSIIQKDTLSGVSNESSPLCASTQWCSTLLHINSGVYFSGSLSIHWCMSSIDPSIDLPCNPLPICLFQRAFKWFVRLSY